MKELYFLRHGESHANTLNLLCGSTWDVELTDLGREQVAQACGFFAGLAIDHIVTSPLKRARSSAEILAKSISYGEFHVHEDLKEQAYGQWERKPFSEIKAAFLGGVNPPGGESHQAFISRLKQALVDIQKLSGRILIVAHGGVGSELMNLLGKEKELIENAKPIRLV